VGKKEKGVVEKRRENKRGGNGFRELQERGY